MTTEAKTEPTIAGSVQVRVQITDPSAYKWLLENLNHKGAKPLLDGDTLAFDIDTKGDCMLGWLYDVLWRAAERDRRVAKELKQQAEEKKKTVVQH